MEKDNDGWIQWTGGECPVAPTDRVQVRFRTEPRSEAETSQERPAGYWNWVRRTKRDYIIAYRVVKP